MNLSEKGFFDFIIFFKFEIFLLRIKLSYLRNNKIYDYEHRNMHISKYPLKKKYKYNYIKT